MSRSRCRFDSHLCSAAPRKQQPQTSCSHPCVSVTDRDQVNVILPNGESKSKQNNVGVKVKGKGATLVIAPLSLKPISEALKEWDAF